METIFLFDAMAITTKDDRKFVKTLMITNDDQGHIHVYTSFGAAEGSILGMLSTPDYRDHMELINISYVGKYQNNSRYVASIEFLDVDAKPQILTVVYNQNY